MDLLAQLNAIQRAAKKVGASNRFNPNPAGTIWPGSASEAVLTYLLGVPGFKTSAQILWAVGRSHSAISWALLFLQRTGRVQAISDTRNPLWKKYRAVKPRGADRE